MNGSREDKMGDFQFHIDTKGHTLFITSQDYDSSYLLFYHINFDYIFRMSRYELLIVEFYIRSVLYDDHLYTTG